MLFLGIHMYDHMSEEYAIMIHVYLCKCGAANITRYIVPNIFNDSFVVAALYIRYNICHIYTDTFYNVHVYLFENAN